MSADVDVTTTSFGKLWGFFISSSESHRWFTFGLGVGLSYTYGEYKVNDVYAGVPVIIGKNGVEKIELIDLDEKEKKEFMHSIDAVKALWEAASKIDPDLSK